MTDNSKFEAVRASLKKIFALPVNKSTFRQIQNTIGVICQGNIAMTNEILESLFNGNFKHGQENLKPIQKEFEEQLKVSRDVFEKGPFLGLITSDHIAQGDRVLFNNLIRRIDGEEIEFISDVESTFLMIKHFIGRLQEVYVKDISKDLKEKLEEEISDLHEMTQTMVSSK